MVRPIRQAQGSPQVVRVRIAPSPTGIPHIGNTRTALFNYLFARHNKGTFIVRIEDTDQKRIVRGAKEAIFAILAWLGLTIDEQYIQSEHVAIYQEHAKLLLKKKVAYEKEGAMFLRVPKERSFTWQDLVGQKQITFAADAVEDFVVLKSDGFPTYHLASVVDDHLMEISHVIRGEEWISSTPKHLLLYESFSWTPPLFAHLPVILGSDRTKLSKRHGAKSVLDYREEGYLKEALLNYMALLGWSPGEDRELMSLSEMIALFDLKDVNTASPIFDSKKLEWMNGVYIRKAKISNLKSQILSQNAKLKDIDNALLDKLIPLAQTRMKTLNDFAKLVLPFVERQSHERKERQKKLLIDLTVSLKNVDPWGSQEILEAIKHFCISQKVDMKVVYNLVTGKDQGLPLPDTLAILGKEKTMTKLQK